MRIAFTGSSSTGKTTLIHELFKSSEFKRYNLKCVTPDARGILKSLGFSQMDLMTKDETRHFQQVYFEKKIELEANKPRLIVERSFIDAASYWLIRDFNGNIDLASKLINEALHHSKKYDLHFYFPSGIIPFEDDGYRSKNETQRNQIDQQIFQFLQDWKIEYVTIDSPNLEERVDLVLKNLRKRTHLHEK